MGMGINVIETLKKVSPMFETTWRVPTPFAPVLDLQQQVMAMLRATFT
jgi:hypothetical protein